MPAESKAQQHVMGAAHAVKTGRKKLSEIEPPEFRAMVKNALRSMTDKQLREFAETRTSKLPKRVRGQRPHYRSK
jgi:hypothetical protein